MANTQTVPNDEIVGVMTKMAPKPAPEPMIETVTRWETFAKANLHVENIFCEGYKPTHGYDSGCHSNVLVRTSALRGHIDNDHGGGFVVRVKVGTPGAKPDPLWNALKTSGLELSEVRCDVCSKVLPLNPQLLLTHLKPHTGDFKRPRATRSFRMTLALAPPMPSMDEAFENE